MKYYRLLEVILILCIALILSACVNPFAGLLGEKEDPDVSYVSYIVDSEDFLDMEDQALRKTLLYYRDEKGILVPVMRRIPWEEGIAKSAINQLIDRPIIREDLSTMGLLPVLPAGTEVIGITIEEGLCKIDFNENILSYNNELDEKAIVQSIVYTLTEFDSIERVQILLGGKTINKLTYGTKIKSPLERKNINLISDLGEESIPVVVYYKSTVNGEESFYIPVTKGINVIKADIKSVVLALLEGAPENTGLYSEIPSGSVLNDVYVKDGVAYIDFSETIRAIPATAIHQQSLVYEIGLTLKELESSISQVRILANGTEIELNGDVSLNLPQFPNEF